MSNPHPPPPPPPQQQQQPPRPQLRPLSKQRSWSPDFEREEVWLRRKSNYRAAGHSRGSKSVTDEDFEELKGCIELGFGFGTDSPDLDPKLSDTLPALEFFCAVNKQYSSSLSRSSSSSSLILSDSDSVSSSSSTMFDPGDDPVMMKTRLKQWAMAVACSARQISGKPA